MITPPSAATAPSSSSKPPSEQDAKTQYVNVRDHMRIDKVVDGASLVAAFQAALDEAKQLATQHLGWVDTSSPPAK
ncbi:MAG TPA: hypothetical protein VGE35_04215 [Candidatus Paceibacterota bacterium]